MKNIDKGQSLHPIEERGIIVINATKTKDSVEQMTLMENFVINAISMNKLVKNSMLKVT